MSNSYGYVFIFDEAERNKTLLELIDLNTNFSDTFSENNFALPVKSFAVCMVDPFVKTK